MKSATSPPPRPPRGPVPEPSGAFAAEALGEEPGQRGNKWWTLVAVCLGTFMLLLDITIVNVALPDIQRALNSSFSDLQWIVDAYALTLAAFLLTAGSLADMFGRRLLYLIGLAVFTLASVLCGFAVSTVMLLAVPRLAGSRRGDHVRGFAGAAGGFLPRQGPRRRVRGLGSGDRPGGSHRPAPRRGADLRSVLAVDLLRERADRDRGRHYRAGKGGRVARDEGQPTRLARLLALHGGAVEPGLRAHRVEPAVFHRRPGPWLPRRGGSAAGRLRLRGATQSAADVRHEAV